MTGRPGTNAPATASGVSTISRFVDVARPDRRRPRDFEVIAGDVAEGGADEAFERARVRRCGPDRGRAAAVRGEGATDACEVAPRLGGPSPGRSGTSASPARSARRDQWRLGESAEQPRGRDECSTARAPAGGERRTGGRERGSPAGRLTRRSPPDRPRPAATPGRDPDRAARPASRAHGARGRPPRSRSPATSA